MGRVTYRKKAFETVRTPHHALQEGLTTPRVQRRLYLAFVT